MGTPVKRIVPTDEIISEVEEIFGRYQDITGAILDDYFIQSGALIEIEAADKQFIDDLNLLEIANPDDENDDDHDDEEAFDRHCKANNMYCVSLTTMDQVEKLRTFLGTEIYPYYSDQSNIHF